MNLWQIHVLSKKMMDSCCEKEGKYVHGKMQNLYCSELVRTQMQYINLGPYKNQWQKVEMLLGFNHF